MTAHDLIFFEKRSTPKVIAKGMSFDAPESYGKQTRRRAATPDEEKKIAKGDWLRVDEHGKKGGTPGYKETRMAGREHLVHELLDELYPPPSKTLNEITHYGVKGMQKGVRKDPALTVSDQSRRPVVKDTIRAAPRAKPVTGGVTVRDVGVASRKVRAPAKAIDISKVKHKPNIKNPDPITKKRMGIGADMIKTIFARGFTSRSAPARPSNTAPAPRGGYYNRGSAPIR